MDANLSIKAGEEFFSFMQNIEEVVSDLAENTVNNPNSGVYGKENMNLSNTTLNPIMNFKSSELAANAYQAVTDYTGTVMPDDFKACRRIWDATCQFMNDYNLVPGQQVDASSMEVVSLEGFGRGQNLNNIGAAAINDLCDAAGIPNDKFSRRQAIREVSLALERMFAFNTSETQRAAHYVNARENYKGDIDNFTMMYPTAILSTLQHDTAMPGEEAFGANIDKVITDTRMTIAITLLRFHKSLLNRMMHRRQRATTIVEYEIPYAEKYDLHKSMDPDDRIRLGREHRTIFLDLYRNPEPVTQKLTPLFPKKDKAHGNEVVDDGILACGPMANLITLSLDENKIGQDHADWTDLVSEGVCFDKVYFTLTKGDTVETFFLDTNKERMVPTAQNRDSSYRQANYHDRYKLHKGFTTAAGATSEILKDLTENECLVLDINLSGGIYLKDGNVQAMGFGSVEAYAKGADVQPSDAVKTLATQVTVNVYGYSVYAFYSEENLRRSNIAFRTNKFMRAYEIMCGRNYMVDYSLNQVLPEYVMAIVTEGMSLGMDDRAMKLFEENTRLVYNRVNAERRDDGYLENIDRINFDFVAGTRVYPYIYIDTIDMREVDTIRSSDFMSDCRQLFDTRLTRIMSLVHAQSLYRQQLEPGEVPTYKLVTSNIILENLFAVPHIHNHIQQLEHRESDGEVVEYTRVLPSGIVLQCITSPWDKMRDKIFICPFRPNFPDSELNYGHNWDYGTFLAHYTPQIALGVNKRLFCNAREIPIITNPVAVSLTIAHFDNYIDLNYVSGNTPSAGA